MITQRIGREKAMIASDVDKEPGVTVSPDREEPALSVHHDDKEPAASTSVQEGVPSTSQPTGSEHLAGDPRALLAARLLAAAALLVTALIHARMAFQLGVGESLGRGQLFLVQAVVSAIIAMAMFTRDSRVWLFAVVLSGSGLLGILASVYFPIPSVGPFPAIDEPTWLLTKGIVALAELTVIALWVIRQIAPPSPPSPPSSPSAPE